MRWKHTNKQHVKERLSQWHEWYAWRPVVADSGSHWIWFERIYKRHEYDLLGFHRDTYYKSINGFLTDDPESTSQPPVPPKSMKTSARK